MLRCYRSCARAPLTLNTIHYRTQREALYTIRRFLSHYKTLGVAKDCTAAEIKSSYYESAKQCHPDIFPEDGDKVKQFLKLQEAYIILSDPNKRRVYDGGQTKPNIPTSPGARGVRYTETQYTQYQGSNNYSHSKRGLIVYYKVWLSLFIAWAVVVFVKFFSNNIGGGGGGNEALSNYDAFTNEGASKVGVLETNLEK